MKRLIVVRGMKRSGNHALVNWLRAKQDFLFLNNVVPMAPILRGEKQRPKSVEFWRWMARRYRLNYVPLGSQFARIKLRGRSLIVGLEDFEPTYQPFRDPRGRVTQLLLLRDPANLFASRIRRAFQVGSPDLPSFPREFNAVMRQSVELWKTCAHEFLGLTNDLSNKVGVYFDRWFIDPDYRRLLCQQLDLPFTDAGLGIVSDHGGGSSFDGTRLDGDSQNMRVLDRFKQLTDEESSLLQKVLDDPELIVLGQRINAHVAKLAA